MEDIFIRKANFKDIDILFEWVNSNDSLRYKLENKNYIPYEDHKKWFLERLNDPNSYIWIIETLYKASIGQIRIQQKENLYFDIDIYIVKEKREMGAAFKALNLSMNQLNNGVLRAIVKKNNEVSFNFFKKCGFKLNSENNLKWVLTKKLDK